jgi:UDP-glucose 4-epimerase
MKVLVTGGAGYIGSITCCQLARAGFEPVVYDSLEKGHRESVSDFKLIVGQTQNQELLTRVLKEEKIEAVVHFAAYIEMGESMKDPGKYFSNNTFGSLSLFQAMIAAGIKKLIFSSTAGVYGQPQKLPIKEEEPKNPNNPYGESKLMVEKILSWYDKIYNFRSITLRYFNAAGATLDGTLGENHHPESHLIPNVIKAAIKDKQFTLYGQDYPTPDGTCIRDYIHVLDLAQTHIIALQALNKGYKSGQYNVGTGKGYSNRQIIKMVEKVTGKKVKVKVGPKRPGDVPQLVADNQKFCQEFSWQPQYSDLETIIKTAWNWYKNGGNYK